jgi:hypothetical protein
MGHISQLLKKGEEEGNVRPASQNNAQILDVTNLESSVQ